MKLKHLYLLLAIVGFVGPYYFFISFLTAHGLDGKLLVQQLFGTQISTFFAVDLLLSCVVFVRFLRQEAVRYSIGSWWIYLIALLTVGLSFALPLFLYVRESHLETRAPGAAGSVDSPA
jgi:Terpene cyclase DEP1